MAATGTRGKHCELCVIRTSRHWLAALILFIVFESLVVSTHAKDYNDYETYGDASEVIPGTGGIGALPSAPAAGSAVEVIECRSFSPSVWSFFFGRETKCDKDVTTPPNPDIPAKHSHEGLNPDSTILNSESLQGVDAPPDGNLKREEGAEGAEELGEPGADSRRPRGPPGSCSCYAIDQPLFSPGLEWSRAMCVCDMVCVYEDRLVQFGNACAEAEPAWQEGRLTPVKCQDDPKHDFEHFKQLALQALKGYQVATHNLSWIEERTRVTWRNGTTVLLSYDDVAAAHVYDFFAQSIPLAYLNSFLSPPGLDAIDRVVIRRSPLMQDVLSGEGEQGMHSVILRALLNGLFGKKTGRGEEEEEEEQVVGPHWLSERDMVFNSDAPLGGGRVEFQTQAVWEEAWEERPVCIERVVLPGSLTSNLYQGGRRFARDFIRRVEQAVDMPPEDAPSGPPSIAPKLLYITRPPGSKRAFTAEAESALRELMRATGLPVRVEDFGGMPFRVQLAAVRWADIVVGMHGTNLLNPTLFLRDGGVMVELFPWHFLWRGHSNTSMSHGGLYLGYMLDEPKGQGGPGNRRQMDASVNLRFQSTSFDDCYRIRQCRRMFRDRRRLHLSSNDLRRVRVILDRAAALAGDVVLTKLGTRNAPLRLSRAYLKRHLGGAGCQEFDTNAQMAWLSFVDVDLKRVETCAFRAKFI